MIKILLSRKLGELRWTQADLARKTGIRPTTINEMYHEFNSYKLIEKEGMDMKSALNCFYNSETYDKLSKPESGLFYQSERYVYALLHKEITTGTLS